jgi:integral membrane protein
MNTLNIFRKVAVAEGISYILLIFIAMPIKYLAHIPEAVKYTGWVHGVLFMLYVVFFIMTWMEAKWKIGKAAMILFASLLPFAPFWVDKRLKEDTENKS